jgi:hypothetical protein
MHDIQKYLLKRLASSESARYSDIRPPKVEGNQFAYHLKEVMNAGLVEKKNTKYILTKKGEMLADRMSMETFKKRIQPKIVTSIVCKKYQNKNEEILFCRRLKQPFFNYPALPYGKIHLGEKVSDAARRELLEKTGIDVPDLSFCGNVYILIYKKGKLFSHILHHVFECQITGSAANKTLPQNCFWSKNRPNESCLPRTQEIIALVKQKKSPFFKELRADIS